mmetsp:Transcript_56877/g.133648  ORF Transcript_56877/g.133648 Transcript_56877/m.133648 type:complete len:335 (+) Transcript_56877:73-1077(+)
MSLPMLARVLHLLAPGLMLAQVSFYCDYACDGKQTSAGCHENYCLPTDAAGCPLVPETVPAFDSAADCDAFAAQHPSCHKGGSCYVANGRPSLPDSLREGFALTGTSSSKEWQFGVSSTNVQGTVSIAVDFLSNLARISQSIESLHGTVLFDTLVRGPDNRAYVRVRTSNEDTCTFVTLNDSMIQAYVHGPGIDFMNISWLADSTEQGVPVHLFAAPAMFAEATVSGDKPPPAPKAGGALLFVRTSNLSPMFSTASMEWAEEDWDANNGLQAMESRTNYRSFTFGKPQADFSVPSSWGECREVPPQHAPPVGLHHRLPAALTARQSQSSVPVQV